ncbi:MAG: RidA family protein [Planctomycetota bacterium]
MERTTRIAPGLHLSRLKADGLEELFITVVPEKGKDPHLAFEHLADVLREETAVVVHQEVFGTPDTDGAGIRALAKAVGEIEWPLTWLLGSSGERCELVGTQVAAVSGVDVARIRRDGRVVGSVFDTSHARCCRLGGLTANPRKPRTDQAREVFDQAEGALAEAGMALTDVIRTWFYLDHILDWYGPFNEVRNLFFTERGLFDGLLPASTGIGGANPAGAALMAGALAIRDKDGSVSVRGVSSPLQCSAADYGSSFSRAVEVAVPGHRHLLVSGTASIGPGRETVHAGDVAAQVARTMEVVAAILSSCRMSWEDVTRKVAFFRHAEDVPALTDYCTEHALPPVPVVMTHNVICRDDLLFEIELDAAAET